MDDQLEITWHTPACLEVAGELDMLTGPLLLSAVLERRPPVGVAIELDLVGVTFVDSTGLRSLIEIHRHGIQLRLTGVSRIVAAVLGITGIGSLFGWGPAGTQSDDEAEG